MPPSPDYRPSARHETLGGAFFDRVRPATFPHHITRFRNERAAAEVGLDRLTPEEWTRYFGYFDPLPGSLDQPLALRYHGHQFQHYNPDLGDGRGFLYAQLHDLRDGRLLDLGTKGSGTTPWSRSGDGRLTLKGGMREVLASEMLEALGVPTSRSFSMIETGESLYRNDEPSPTRSCVLVRLSHSHIRIGSFQRLAALGEKDNLRALIDYTIDTYFPEIDGENRILKLFESVCQKVARTGARWCAAGFVHGVLNTDNINVTGESFDYGPWRFMPFYNPLFTAAYFDRGGLYSYGNQPNALVWNLGRFAECLIPFADQSELQSVIDGYNDIFQRQMHLAVIDRLGIFSQNDDADKNLSDEIIDFLFRSKMPFESFFFDWYGGANSEYRASKSPYRDQYLTTDFSRVRMLLENYAGNSPDHPYFQKEYPQTMLIDQVETIWKPIDDHDNWDLFNETLINIAQMRDAYASGANPKTLR